MIPVGTSVNPGELRSGPKWGKTFISCLEVPDTSPGTHLVYILVERSFSGLISFRSLIRACTGSFANVYPAFYIKDIEAGQIYGLSKNGS